MNSLVNVAITLLTVGVAAFLLLIGYSLGQDLTFGRLG